MSAKAPLFISKNGSAFANKTFYNIKVTSLVLNNKVLIYCYWLKMGSMGRNAGTIQPLEMRNIFNVTLFKFSTLLRFHIFKSQYVFIFFALFKSYVFNIFALFKYYSVALKFLRFILY